MGSSRQPFDDVTSATRKIMRAVRSRNTKPELAVRHLLHGLGYRYRLHRKGLPGRPDLAFGPRKKVIFVHGCFWHRHAGCSKATHPKTRSDFWASKFAVNVSRDARNIGDLTDMGWRSLIVWECEAVGDEAMLMDKVVAFLDDEDQKPPNNSP